MKKIKREPYLILTNIDFPKGNPLMCSFCRHSKWAGNCKDAECECGHPLSISENCSWGIEREVEDAMTGEDCFLFQPAFTPEVAADIVGIWLQEKEPDWDTVPRLSKRRNREK